MAFRTGIEWTDHTFNIAHGCQKVSPGCAHCYAEHFSVVRFGQDVFGPAKTTARRTFTERHWRQPLVWNRSAARFGTRRRVFCSSMADVFEEHPTIVRELARLWELIRLTPHLDWQLLTKRPENILRSLPPDWGDGYPNVWLGTSVENQEWADHRVYWLSSVPARVRFLSAEPLLGPITMRWPYGLIHWVIAGGESGPNARPMDPDWVRSLRDQCRDAGIPFFLKQLGGHPDKRAKWKAVLDGRRHLEWPESWVGNE